MAIKFNSSFQSKINSYAKSAAGQKKLAIASEAEAQAKATEAGEQLAQSVESAISSSGMNGRAIAAVGDVSSTGAYPIGDGVYHVGIHIGNVFRPSLVPEVYGGVNDMAALLNKGYDTGRQVFGQWHGAEIGSLVHREGAQFVQNGVADFLGSYGGPCEIISCDISDRF